MRKVLPFHANSDESGQAVQRPIIPEKISCPVCWNTDVSLMLHSADSLIAFCANCARPFTVPLTIARTTRTFSIPKA